MQTAQYKRMNENIGGEIFGNEDWNRDIDFGDAFRTSCVWYYRQLIDEIGEDRMQTELEKLQYGNCDISDWEGRLNTNNNNRALAGFWLESSLMISPIEQTEVLERIFGEDSAYSKETRNELKQVMRVSNQESAEGNLYFCVRLAETDKKNISSALAKEIAVQIAADYYGQ